MMGGKAAAEVLLACRAAGDFSRRSTRLYERRWMEVFGHDFKLVRGRGYWLAAWLAGWASARYGEVGWQGVAGRQGGKLSVVLPKPSEHPGTAHRPLHPSSNLSLPLNGPPPPPPLRPCSPRRALSLSGASRSFWMPAPTRCSARETP
jgi:hypothetical protein